MTKGKNKKLKASASAPAVGTEGGKPGEAPAPVPVEDPPTSDPFKDWKASVSDMSKMNLKQLKMLDLEGIRELQNEMIYENKQFKQCWLKELDDDKLFLDRTRFGEFGIAAAKKQEKKRDKYTTVTEELLRRQAERRDLFAYYGLRLPSPTSAPDTRMLSKLMKNCIERSPYEQERKLQESLELKRQKDEERRKKDLAKKNSLQRNAAG